MIYYKYELRWRGHHLLKNLEKDRKTEFEMNYTAHFMSNINEEFYNRFLRESKCIMQITGRTEAELEVYMAVVLRDVEIQIYEQELLRVFSDCEISRKVEVTIGEFRRELSVDSFNCNVNRIFEKLGINYRENYFEPFPFKLEETVMDSTVLDKEACRRRAKDILGSKNLYEELDRIYSDENQKAYFGHPVHYMISAGDWKAAQDIYELLVSALISNKRLASNRMVILRDISKKVHKDERYPQILKAAEGGIVVIELKSEKAMGRFATDFHEFMKLTGALLEQQKRDTLFLFIEVMGKSLKDNDALNHILTKADMIQITEGTGTLEDAKKYLMELAEQVDFHSEDKSDILQYLPESESYSVTDIFNAYNAWYGSGLKNHVYKAYKEKKTFRMEIKKVENKPYDELQAMIGLTEVKTVIDRVIAASKVLRARESMGLNTDTASLHMLFSGNPGTAKTTVARLLTKILKEEDAIQSGKFVECGRQDLVGMYVGWTAHIVEDKFKEAMGGVLFIDEAYSLVDDSNTYGAEAINCITQMMENYRNDVIVIFAGYPKKMQEFLEQNEGLKSRIAFHLDFPDYSTEELLEIIKLMSKKREYTIEEDALVVCREIFEQATTEENFGNGRYARNVLEQAMLKQSNRIVNDCRGEELSREEMCCLQREDFEMPDKSSKSAKKIGF